MILSATLKTHQTELSLQLEMLRAHIEASPVRMLGGMTGPEALIAAEIHMMLPMSRLSGTAVEEFTFYTVSHLLAMTDQTTNGRSAGA